MEFDPAAKPFLSAQSVLPLCLLVLLLGLSTLGLHGFSLPYWHRLLDHSPANEVLLGEARKIRIDDWAVHLPLVLSQAASEPRFPVKSDLVAYGGVDMRVGFPVPVADWVTAFRPQLWGYFFGRDFGLAWNWWFRVFALFCAGFLAFRVLAQARVALALAGACALTWAPFFQFWAFSYEPHVAAALFCFVSLVNIAKARSHPAMVGWGLFLAWAAGCFALGLFYPPHQITLAYLLGLVSAVYLFRERAAWIGGGRLRARAATAAIALGLAAAAVLGWFVRSSEAIGLVANTIYPGGRFEAGGDLSPLHAVNNFFTLFLGENSLRAFQSISEAAAFLYLSPLVVAVVGFECVAARRRPDPLVVALAGYQALLGLYAFVGFPNVLARMVFLGRVPAQRTILALGVADLLLLVTFLSSRLERAGKGEDGRAPSRVAGDEAQQQPFPVALGSFIRSTRIVIPGLWWLGLIGVGFAVAARVGSTSRFAVVAISLLFLAVGLLVATRHRYAAVSLAILSVASTFWFNPLVRGGSDYLERNPFCATVLSLDRAAGGGTRWIVFNDPRLSNLFRAIGVRSVGGVHYYPQRELWSRLGLAELAAEQWNRYANVQFALKEEQRQVGLQIPFPDQVIVRIHPDHPLFARLGVDYVVFVAKDRQALDDARSLSWVTSVGDNHIYRVVATR